MVRAILGQLALRRLWPEPERLILRSAPTSMLDTVTDASGSQGPLRAGVPNGMHGKTRYGYLGTRPPGTSRSSGIDGLPSWEHWPCGRACRGEIRDERISTPLLISRKFRDGTLIRLEVLGAGPEFAGALEAAGLTE
jgi:hypothetical protein